MNRWRGENDSPFLFADRKQNRNMFHQIPHLQKFLHISSSLSARGTAKLVLSLYSIFVLFRYWQVKKLCPKCEYQWSDDISSTMFNLRKVGNESIFYFSITLALGPGEGTARCHDKLTWFIQKCTQCRPTNALHWKFSGLIKWRIFLNLKVTSQLGYEFFDVFCHSAVNNLE